MKRLGALVLAAAVTAAGSTAGAAPWPMFGADEYHTGARLDDAGGVPAVAAWSRLGGTDAGVRTSIVTGSGPAESQHLAYGTDAGRIVVRKLLTGAAVGPAGGVDVSAAANPFGGGTASVTPVIAADSDRHGQIYAIVNERVGEGVGTPTLQLAQIDEATGVRSRDDITLPGLEDFVIESSPVLRRFGEDVWWLFFVARQEGGTIEALFRIEIVRAQDAGSVIGAITTTADVNANPQASPSFVGLVGPDDQPSQFVAVSTVSDLLTFRMSDLVAGPSAIGIGENPRTPSSPSMRDSLYVASGAASTVLHHVTQVNRSQTLTVRSTVSLDGVAANGIANDGGSFVYVSTSVALYAVRGDTLVVVGAAPGSFRDTVPAVTGEIVAIADDAGNQRLLDGGTLAAVDPSLFDPGTANAGAVTSFGQPAIASRFLQFASSRGVFVYALRRATKPTGYLQVAADGGLFTHGNAAFFGSTGDIRLNFPIVGMVTTPTELGYWTVAADGGVFAFGDATFAGSTGSVRLNSPVVGMAASPTGLGYLLVAADGGVFAFGDATFFGSTGNVKLNSPIVGMAMTPTGLGYWLVAADGGGFAFGDATFFGSTGATPLNAPVVAIAAEPTGKGYWIVARDGGVFAFGAAVYFGSTGDVRLNAPIVGIAASATGEGYVFTATDGGVFTFGDAPFLGAAASMGRLNLPVVGIAAKP